ncbi:MAG: hypothetical protein LCI00_24660 [Chloroflexi bacterium]|nr:hypothetical protein [Chloroflexota bacterium]MCC6895822.1 hypothetical protein [Anaerolineae bacterium]
MSEIGFLIIITLLLLAFFAIGLVLRNRPRMVQKVVTSIIFVVVCLSITLIGSAIGLGVYHFYHYQVESCQSQTPPCLPQSEQEQLFLADIPRLTIWLTVPKFLRPSCETISSEFCYLGQSFDMSPFNYIAGTICGLICVGIVLLGMRRKPRQVVT